MTHHRLRGKGERIAGGGAVHTAASIIVDVASESPSTPPADINETAEGVVIRIEVPGVPAEDIHVMVHGSTVEVWGEKKRERIGQEASFLCLERSFGPFRRAFELAGCFNMAGVAAELSGGILTVTIPKCEERRGRARRVPIAVGGGEPGRGERDAG